MENIFYTQERIGKWGKTFRCYKIQTMYAGFECPDEQIRTGVKYEDDPRIILRVNGWEKQDSMRFHNL